MTPVTYLASDVSTLSPVDRHGVEATLLMEAGGTAGLHEFFYSDPPSADVSGFACPHAVTPDASIVAEATRLRKLQTYQKTKHHRDLVRLRDATLEALRMGIKEDVK